MISLRWLKITDPQERQVFPVDKCFPDSGTSAASWTYGIEGMEEIVEHYLIMYHPPRAGFAEDITSEEQAVVDRHFQYLTLLASKGVLKFAGRPTNARFGIALLQVDSSVQAEDMMQADPAIAEGLFRGELLPFQVSFLSV